jgi:hypothetical protein
MYPCHFRTASSAKATNLKYHTRIYSAASSKFVATTPQDLNMPTFVPRQRKHKIQKRVIKSHDQEREQGNGDANATLLLPASKQEQEEKRRALKEKLRSDAPKISGKKQKRLDKYIVCLLPILPIELRELFLVQSC